MTDPNLQRPSYMLPWRPRPAFIFDFLLARRRSFAHDSGLVMAKNPYPRRFEGFDKLPAKSPFVLVMNHFNRPRLHPYHVAMAITDAIARQRPGEPELSWLFTNEWYDARWGPLHVPVWSTRWFFRRLSIIYRLVVLPRKDGQIAARASSLRQVLSILRDAPIAITPEGGGSGRLQEPPEGSGLFLAILSGHGYPLFPLAIWEDDSTLTLRVGEPFQLSLPRDVPRDEADRRAREEMMVAIGRLLPRDDWGVYASAIEASFKASSESRP